MTQTEKKAATKEVHTLVGRKVKAVRKMTAKELESEGWSGQAPPVVIVFDNGDRVFASCDSEGNGPGVLFGNGPRGGSFYV